MVAVVAIGSGGLVFREYQTINGSVRVELDDNLMIAEFKQAVDGKLMREFLTIMAELAAYFEGQPWGYISHSIACDAATPEAEELLVASVLQGRQLGCVAGAYVINSCVALSQSDRILKKAGLDTGIEGRHFDTLTSAKQYLNKLMQGLA